MAETIGDVVAGDDEVFAGVVAFAHDQMGMRIIGHAHAVGIVLGGGAQRWGHTGVDGQRDAGVERDGRLSETGAHAGRLRGGTGGAQVAPE